MNEEKRIYAAIDTNVLVSSLFSSSVLSNPAKVIRAIINGSITPLYNAEIIEEYREVLYRNKFKFKPYQIEPLLRIIIELGIDTIRTKAENLHFPDKDDIVFYEVTMSVEDAYLVTGNTKHFPKKPFVITPAEMVKILCENGLI